MGRGIGLACESCAFTATVLERVGVVRDDAGAWLPFDANAFTTPTAYQRDWFCGDCRLPERLLEFETDVPASGDVAAGQQGEVAQRDGPRCSRCGSPLLTFDVAMRELAEACHSRVWLDLEVEREAEQCLRKAINQLPGLNGEVESGRLTTQEALDQLAQQVTPLTRAEVGAGHEAVGTTALATTHTLNELGALVENAADLDSASRTLADRLRASQQYASGLRACVEDEAYLAGVPCPQCSSGHLVHWPIWY